MDRTRSSVHGNQGALKRGEVGTRVRELQRGLTLLGYPVDESERIGARFGSSTAEAMKRFQADRSLAETGVAEPATLEALRDKLAEIAKLERFEIRGTVRRRDGSAWAGATVEAFDVELRSVQLLGRVRTDAQGGYLIEYPNSRFRDRELRGPDLVVRVPRDQGGEDRESVLDARNAHAFAGPIFQAPVKAVVDLYEDGAIHAGRSAWEELTALLAPLLGKIDAASLTDDEIEFLSREAGIERRRVELYARAWRRSADAARSHRRIPPEACFALFARQPPSSARDITAWTAGVARRALADAMPLVIPQRDREWIEEVVRELRRFAAAETAADPAGPALIARVATGGDDALALAFVERFLEHDGDIPSLWDALRKDERFAAHVPALQRVTQLAVLARHHAPMVAVLERQFRESGADGLDAFLPEVSDDTWRKWVERYGHPEDTTPEEYVGDVRALVETAHSTRFVAARIDRLGVAHAKEVAAFLRAHARELDLQGAPIDKLLADRPEAATAPSEVLTEVARLQRLHKAIGSVDDLAVLVKAAPADMPPLGSAGDIARLGRHEVRRRFGEDTARADRVYDRAVAAHHRAVAYWGSFRPELDKPFGMFVPPALGNEPLPMVPPMASLSIDFCGCERCRSVLSPAAYLADLLAFVERIKAPTSHPLAYLYYRLGGPEERRLRRADLGTILLDCPNTTTPLPYIDLVNELLEWHAAGKNDPFTYQTTRTADELLVAPEHVLPEVYDTLLPEAVYPWRLPFSLPHETARAFLAHFGLDRRSLMITLAGPGFATTAIERAREGLGLFPRQGALLADASSEDPWALWGLAETGNRVIDPFDTNDPPQLLPPLDWREVLQYGMHLRRQSGLEQEVLLAVLHSRYVRDAFDPATIDWPVTECSFDRARLRLSEPQLRTIHGFARLVVTLGWSPEQLDVVLDAVGRKIDDTTLIVIEAASRLARRGGVPIVEAIAWIAAIPVWPHEPGGTSLYEQTFLSPAANPNHRAALELTPARDGLAAGGGPLTAELRSVIGAAVGLSTADVDRVLDAETTTGKRFVADELSLPTLSSFFRIASLARTCRLGVDGFLRLAALQERPPVPTAAPGAPLASIALTDAGERIDQFFDTVDLVRNSGFSIEEIVFLTTGEDVGVRPLAPAERTMTEHLRELHTELTKVARDAGWPTILRDPAAPPPPPWTPPPELDADALQRLVEKVPGLGQDGAGVKALVEGRYDDATRKAFIEKVFKALEPETSRHAALIADAIAKLDVSGPDDKEHERFVYLAEHVVRWSSLSRQRRTIRKKVAEIFGLSDSTAALLLEREAGGPSIVADLEVASGPLVETFVPGNLTSWFAAYRRLHRHALLVRRWRLDSPDLATVLALGSRPGSGWLRFETLPLSRTLAGAEARFSGWATLARAVRLRDRAIGATRSIWSVFALVLAGAPTDDVLGALAEWRGVPIDTLRAVATALDVASGLHDPRTLERLLAALETVTTLGTSIDEARMFAAPGIQLAEANRIRDLARASRPITEWISIARPLQDRLRTRQRDALLAYLCATRGMTPRQLFDFLLIDVEMSDCQLTSRIQQAICSVQLFIQRVSMHLELATNGKPLELGSDEREEWRTWLGTYRSWVEARSVFLYPESTLDPALRRDKSEPFVALEKKLDQAEVTNEIARDLVREYLEELDRVALLETRAVCVSRLPEPQQPAPSPQTSTLHVDQDVTHVLARTRGMPHRYYYRQRTKSRWTPWEKVDIDINDEHVVLHVYHGRLFAFWLQFSTKGDEEANRTPPTDEDEPRAPVERYEIQLAWSERKDGKWLPKRVSREKVETPLPNGLLFFPNGAVMLSGAPRPEEYSIHPMSGTTAARVLNTTGVREDDLWIMIRSSRREVIGNLQFAEALLGWFVLSGCNGATVRENIYAIAYKGEVGPLEISLENKLVDNDWDQKDVLFLRDGFQDRQALGRTGPTRIAHPMTFDVADDTFFRPPMVLCDHRRTYAIFASDNQEAWRRWRDPQLVDPSMVVFDRPLPWVWFGVAKEPRWSFVTFYHPYTCKLIEKLDLASTPRAAFQALFSAESQEEAQPLDEPFNQYAPQPTAIARPYPQERIELDFDAAYAPYNWELFFYIPLLVSDRLRANQRYDEALEWLQFVYDPTSPDAAIAPERAWQFLPLRNRTDLKLKELLALLDYSQADPNLVHARKLMEAHLEEWRANALDPHAVARHRPGAWMRAVIKRYVETLIAWGDSLFRRDTIESINQATLMYLLALDVLGERPRDYPPRAMIAAKTYNELRAAPLDAFSNALVQIENWVPPSAPLPAPNVPIPAGLAFYFCIPRNDRLDRLWDMLADRLYKVRHCLDIEGRFRQLALFDGLLDRLDKARQLGDALDGQGEVPTYRFQILVQKANELAGDVQRLGASLLAALEKKDAEALSLLRSTHERALLAAIHDVKARQVEEARRTLESLTKSREAAQTRFDYYASRQLVNPQEKSHLTLMQQSLPLQDAANAMDNFAGFARMISDFVIGISGMGGSPVNTFSFGGTQIGGAASAIAGALRTRANQLVSQASLALTIGGYHRRFDDWMLQRDLARIELEQIDRQIAAAQIRLEVTELELANHELQQRQADEVAGFLTSKFTSEELYGWMVEQLGVLYLQAYELAYDLGKRAERAFRFERGDLEATFLQPAYFDQLRKGLLAGERLQLDLRRMEAAYLEQNRREYELTRHISLVQEYPEALLALLTLGTCTIELPESLFDRDHPGHYFRRIKSLSLSLPCVGGSFAAVNAKVTIESSKVRIRPEPPDPYPENPINNDAHKRFAYRWTPIDSFAVSTGNEDGGVFEANLRDDRFLPCEGAGAIAKIRIDLPLDQPDIDPRRISDAILHLRYTARDGGEALAEAARSPLTVGTVFASARHDLADAWERFRVPAAGTTVHTLAIDLRADRFPYWALRGGSPDVTPSILIALREPLAGGVGSIAATLVPPSSTTGVAIQFDAVPDNDSLLASVGPTDGTGEWSLVLDSAGGLDPTLIDDIFVVGRFTT